MRRFIMFGALLLSMLTAARLVAQEKSPRKWDQAKGKKLVEKTLAVEKQGSSWDKIKWSTNVNEVVAKAKKEDKPIFVYWYVKAGGPAKAPC